MNEKKDELNDESINDDLNKDNLETTEIIEDIINNESASIEENVQKKMDENIVDIKETIEDVLTEDNVANDQVEEIKVEEIKIKPQDEEKNILVEPELVSSNNEPKQTQQSVNFDPYLMNQQLNQTNKIGQIGLILSIAAIIVSFIPFLNFISWLVWIGGLVCSIIGLTKKPKGMAIAGLIISLLGIIIMLFLVAMIATALAASSAL